VNFNELIQGIGSSLGTLQLRPDKEGIYSFEIDKSTKLYVRRNSKDPNKVYAYSDLCHFPADKNECKRLMGALLWANLFAQGTNGAVFTADRDKQLIYFMRTLNLKKISLKVVFVSINDLVRHIDAWRERVQTKQYFVNYQNPMSEREPIESHWKRI